MGGGVTVAVVGANDVAKELGKKGTQSDITMYNSVREGHATTLVEPTQFPEKLPPLLTALGMADRILLVVMALSRDVAETVATVDLFDRPTDIVLGPAVGEAEVRKAFRGTRVADAPAHPLDLPKLRSELESWVSAPPDGPLEVPIDHAFPVKGVGTVALGFVKGGSLNAHEPLRLYPTPRSVEVRSIQVHDVDVKSASPGERVGMALKGVDADEVTRGSTLAREGSLRVSERFKARIVRRCAYYRGTLAAGMQLHLWAGLQFVPAGIESVEASSLRLEIDRPVVLGSRPNALLADLSAAPGPRVVGSVELETESNPHAEGPVRGAP